jgi:alkaline phosphatase
MRTDIATVRQLLTRRAILRRTSLFIAGAAASGCSQLTGGPDRKIQKVCIGLVADVHYADKNTGGTRHYRDSLAKLSTAVDQFNKAETDFVVELGDFIDAADSVDEEIGYLKRIENIYARARCPRHHVLGNHCVETLTKEQFLAQCGASRSYYSFDLEGFHFIVLDACFRHDNEPYGKGNFKWTDANIPPAELDWLEADLAETRYPTIAFVHQRLDVKTAHGIRNQADVRQRLEASGKVLTVFQGHNHVNNMREINGIHYCTLAAMVQGPVTENNAYGVLKLHVDGSMHLDGFGQQRDRHVASPQCALQ